MKNRRNISIIALTVSLSITAALIFLPATPGENREKGILQVTFLDIHQGDSQVIQTPEGKVIVIDGGQRATRYSPFDAGKEVVIPYLESQGIKKIDVVVATHPDYDHTGGLIAVLNSHFPIGMVLDCGIVHTTATYKKYMEAIQGKKIPIIIPDAGDILDWGPSIRAQVLAPVGPPDRRGNLNLNNNSIVIRLEYEDVSFLFTGDCEHEEENIILSSGARIKSTILKAGHHGSRTASGSLFYYMCDPEVVTISAGRRNKFNHPHWEPMKLFRETGAEIYQTNYLGNITVLTDGKNYEVITGDED
ncbi:MAG: ComEC/Rec2 family competence protein [Candidatus Auribacterota bacterium]|nr:ComEC/Rec2 family competence protein [Candidatus Auribacterota bacterium]